MARHLIARDVTRRIRHPIVFMSFMRVGGAGPGVEASLLPYAASLRSSARTNEMQKKSDDDDQANRVPLKK